MLDSEGRRPILRRILTVVVLVTRMKLRPQLLAASVLLLAALAVPARGQYVEDSIDVGGWYVGSLAYNSRADVVYGGSQSDDIFFAIECASNQVVASWFLSWPRYLAYDSIDNKAYCSFLSGGEDSVLVVDGATHRRLRAIGLRYANYIVWDQLANRLYVSCTDDNRVAVIDCETDQIVGFISTGSEPVLMYLHPTRRRLYVFADGASAVNIVDLTTLQIVGNVWIDGSPKAGCYSVAAAKFYCGGYEEVVVIDGIGDSLSARIPLSSLASVYSLACADASGLVFVGTHSTGVSDSVFVVDVSADSVVSRIPTNGTGECAVWSPASNTVYFSMRVTASVLAMRGDRSGAATVLPVAYAPWVLLPVAGRGRVYLGHLGSDMVYVIRDTAAGIEERLAARPRDAAWLSAAPSPFRDRVRLRLAESTGQATTVKVFAADGRLVRSLAICARTGRSVVWDGRDEAGVSVSAGTYIAVLKGGEGARAMLVKQ